MEEQKTSHFWNKSAVTRLYYLAKPAIPRSVQIMLRRMVIKRAMPRLASVWPIDEKAGRPPEGWAGWPQGKQFALVLTHDVESVKGVDRCRQLAQMEMELGFRSSFNFVVKKYSTPDELRQYLVDNGFEVGVHGCYHDGKKFTSRKIFMERARIINQYLENWGATGFRSPSMHCNLDWIGELDIEYDLSTFDTDPFEPQAGGVGTIFPFLVPKKGNVSHFVELPYTLTQDFTAYVLLGEKTADIWKRKLDWIVEKGGMALLNVHPDYMAFGRTRPGIDEYPAHIYEDFLHYLKERYGSQCYHSLPRELARLYASQHGGGANQSQEELQE
jgi:peptidoglycan/xylan/chitin deacetylase (PgdA/CDA1 family)